MHPDTMQLIDNTEADWSHHEFYVDSNGQSHLKHLRYGDDYTLEEGDLLDAVEAVLRGDILDFGGDENA